MSDPRAVIKRAVAPPPSPRQDAGPAPAALQPAGRQIGKAHGRMRCVNLALTPEAKRVLYEAAETQRVSLGEALVELVQSAHVQPAPERGGRSPAQRRGLTTTAVFVLLTPTEASTLADAAADVGHSLSSFVTTALESVRS